MLITGIRTKAACNDDLTAQHEPGMTTSTKRCRVSLNFTPLFRREKQKNVHCSSHMELLSITAVRGADIAAAAPPQFRHGDDR